MEHMSIESLTKENFWNEMMEKYPGAMKRFCAWMDEYKKRVEWELIFKERHSRNGDGDVVFEKPKFHDLPIAMQIGIFGQYSNEMSGLPMSELVKGSKRLIESDLKQFESKKL